MDTKYVVWGLIAGLAVIMVGRPLSQRLGLSTTA